MWDSSSMTTSGLPEKKIFKFCDFSKILEQKKN